MAIGELEPDPELADDTLGGRISETQPEAEPTCSGSWWAWGSPGAGGSTMPHVRMWERLQSSHAHLVGRGTVTESARPATPALGADSPPPVVAVGAVGHAQPRRQHVPHSVCEAVLASGCLFVGELEGMRERGVTSVITCFPF